MSGGRLILKARSEVLRARADLNVAAALIDEGSRTPGIGRAESAYRRLNGIPEANEVLTTATTELDVVLDDPHRDDAILVDRLLVVDAILAVAL